MLKRGEMKMNFFEKFSKGWEIGIDAITKHPIKGEKYVLKKTKKEEKKRKRR